jgi:peptidoglycan/xylan/chitin deacetylase (PgdA/CDA1 family)
MLLSINHSLHYGWFILLALLYISVIALGSYFIQLQFFTYSYCRGNTQQPQIAITFDDGPHSIRTKEILDILKTEKVPATFFCIGKNIKGQEDILKQIDTDGHLVGTHSFDHQWSFPLQKKSSIADEIIKSQKAISNVIYKKPLLFRPPFGVTDPPLAAAIQQSKVKSIGWSVRSYDTVISSPDALLKRIRNIKNGDIILFHEAGLQTNVILPLFIKYARSKGFEFIPLNQLLAINAYEI